MYRWYHACFAHPQGRRSLSCISCRNVMLTNILLLARLKVLWAGWFPRLCVSVLTKGPDVCSLCQTVHQITFWAANMTACMAMSLFADLGTRGGDRLWPCLLVVGLPAEVRGLWLPAATVRRCRQQLHCCNRGSHVSGESLVAYDCCGIPCASEGPTGVYLHITRETAACVLCNCTDL